MPYLIHVLFRSDPTKMRQVDDDVRRELKRLRIKMKRLLSKNEKFFKSKFTVASRSVPNTFDLVAGIPLIEGPLDSFYQV